MVRDWCKWICDKFCEWWQQPECDCKCCEERKSK